MSKDNESSRPHVPKFQGKATLPAGAEKLVGAPTPILYYYYPHFALPCCE